MIVYFADRSMNILGCAGTDIDKGYYITNDDKEEDVDNGVATFQFTFIFSEEYEPDARALVTAGNYVLLKRDGADECYTIIYNELDRADGSIEVYAEDAGLQLLNEVSPKFNHYSAFDKALENKGLDDYKATAGAHAGKWEVSTYNTGEDSIIDVDALADRVYGDHGEAANAINWYTHVAYANKDDNGNIKDFSLTNSSNREYFGACRDTNSKAPTDSSQYSWHKAADRVPRVEVTVTENGRTGKKKVRPDNFKMRIAYGNQENNRSISGFSLNTSVNSFKNAVGGCLCATDGDYTSETGGGGYVLSNKTGGSSGSSNGINVGDTVRIRQGARDMNYHCTFASWVYQRDYTVIEVRGNRVVFGWSNGAITGVTEASNIIGGSGGSSGSTPARDTTPPIETKFYEWGTVKKSADKVAVGKTETFTCSTNEDIGNSKHKLKEYYTNYARTYYYFTQPTLVRTQYYSDDGSSIYLNGELVGTNGGDNGDPWKKGIPIYLYFNKGWNIVEIVLHQVTAPNYWKFTSDPAKNSNCREQNSLSDFLDPHSIEWYFNEFAGTTGFEIGVNELKDYTLTLAWDSEDTTANRLLSLVNEFGGEMCYTFDIDHMLLKHMYVNFYNKRGSETDIELRFGRDISNIHVKTSIENLATALYATGDNIDEQKHELTLFGYQYDDGDIYVDSDGLLKSREALKTYHRYKLGNDDGHVVKTFSYQTQSQSELFKRAYNELISVDKPEINYEVEIQIPPKDVKIGDTIRIIDEKGGLYLRARVIKLERKIAEDELTITLGDYLIEESKISQDIKYLADQFKILQDTAKTYTWFVYADDTDGTNISIYPYDTTTDDQGNETYSNFRKYVGIAYNMPSPSVQISDPTLFQWSLIKGENGAPGQNGNDGKTYYFHVAYGNKDENGNITDFSTTDSEGREYIGTYTDENEPDGTSPAAYKWQLVKGEKGESEYVHFAYANKLTGGQVSFGKLDGSKVRLDTETAEGGSSSGNVAFADGKVIFSETTKDSKPLYAGYFSDNKTIKFNSGNIWADFSTTDSTDREYMGVCTDNNQEAPTDPEVYTWTKIVGKDGATGRGVKQVLSQYYLSSSQQTQAGGEWLYKPEAYKPGYFYWTRTETTWSDDSDVEYSEPVLDEGLNSANSKADSAESLAKKSVKGFIQEYYLSTSNTELADGEWSIDIPTKTDDTYYWIRYKTTYQDDTVSYSPSEDGKLLTDINELWARATENKTAIETTNNQVNITATSITSMEHNLESKVDKNDYDDQVNSTKNDLDTLREQVASLRVESDNITAQVTDNQRAIGEVKQATAQLTTDGLNVDTGLTTVSTVDGKGLTVKDKTTNEIIANFTTGQSTIQNLKVQEQLQVGSHMLKKMDGEEYDGTTVSGTGFMWTGGE